MNRQRPASACLPAAIAALSLSLPGSHVSPETFRQAKFDQPQVSATFWKLLYYLLKQIHGGGQIESADPGTQVRFVKCAALNYGYRRLKFYQLPTDGSEGSRELLLAFSWFLCRIALMEKLLTLSRLKLWDEATVCMCNPPLKCLQDGKSLASELHIKDQTDVQYLQWLNGRLKLQWRSCHIEQQEQCKLLHKVHSYTVGSHSDPVIGHFSVIEVDIGRQPDKYEQLLHFVESDCSRLEAFLKWKPMEPLYWHWMETVLDMVTEDTQKQNMCGEDCLLPGNDLGCHSASRIIEELDKCKKDLMTLCQELRERRTLRKLACYGKVRTRREKQGEEDFCTAIRKVQEIVELKLSDLNCNNSTCRINKLHGPYRLVFKRKCLKESKMDTIRTAALTKAITEGITATDVISDLKKKVERLKAELKHRQEEDRQKIHKVAKGLDQVLFIPPMKRQKAKIGAEFGRVHHI
ncbi:tubulin epsilon and delta complex protein 1 isoform X1 [Python bivittatus]|uniref:Tubulin epsilon and delta complex protein 1 isoform X1 n=1 Tax=Python bivittatus TaxID=176946 RepID=A0A9F2R1I6_PYTBI|nr:tubulin epsilon and delta complex protein 1 isoform X1 [Python bivittatus]